MPPAAPPDLRRRCVAEGLGTAFLLVAVVGSGIMGDRLAGGNVAIALLANAVATGCALYVLILLFGGLSGAHFNPLVSVAAGLPRQNLVAYVLAQVAGAVLGVWVAHLMFDLPPLQVSTHVRAGPGQFAGEFVASFGLLALIERGRRAFPGALPAAVAAYITGAYWFTSSTSFANPAVTVARALTDTFAGIAPASVLPFLAAQALGATCAVVTVRWLDKEKIPTISSPVAGRDPVPDVGNPG